MAESVAEFCKLDNGTRLYVTPVVPNRTEMGSHEMRVIAAVTGYDGMPSLLDLTYASAQVAGCIFTGDTRAVLVQGTQSAARYRLCDALLAGLARKGFENTIDNRGVPRIRFTLL